MFGEVIDGARTVKDIELLGSSGGKPSKKVSCYVAFGAAFCLLVYMSRVAVSGDVGWG